MVLHWRCQCWRCRWLSSSDMFVVEYKNLTLHNGVTELLLPLSLFIEEKQMDLSAIFSYNALSYFIGCLIKSHEKGILCWWYLSSSDTKSFWIWFHSKNEKNSRRMESKELKDMKSLLMSLEFTSSLPIFFIFWPKFLFFFVSTRIFTHNNNNNNNLLVFEF